MFQIVIAAMCAAALWAFRIESAAGHHVPLHQIAFVGILMLYLFFVNIKPNKENSHEKAFEKNRKTQNETGRHSAHQ